MIMLNSFKELNAHLIINTLLYFKSKNRQYESRIL